MDSAILSKVKFFNSPHFFIIDKLLKTVYESRSGWVFCDEHVISMAQSVREQIYWEVELIVPTEQEGCTTFQELLDDDGLGLFSIS